MSYIGKEPADSFISFAKQDFTTSATTSYTLNNAVTNENELALFINFVRQEPTTAYTASGTTLTLTSATASSDDMYCVYLGQAKQTVNAPDGSVGSSQVAASIITGQTALASEPADTDEFLVSDAGTLKRIDYSLIKGGGITEADQWRLTANSNTGSNSDITSNWERNDGTGYGSIGTGLTESSGIFSFPSTGIYLINAQFAAQMEANDVNVEVEFMVTTNNSSYTTVAFLLCGNGGPNNNTRNSLAQSYILDVTDTSNVKFKFHTGSFAGSTTVVGDTNTQISGFTSIRLGDT